MAARRRGNGRTPAGNRVEDDALLRSFGYKIHSRPDRGEPVWEKGGRVVPQSQALAAVRAEIGRVAR
jgi:hypothetical protein